MDSERIKKLLDRYWECETTLEEEKELREYFASDQVDDQFKDVAPLFQFYKNEKHTTTLDGMFDQDVLNQIEAESAPEPKKGKLVVMFANISKVAAVALIVVTAGYFIKQEMAKEEVKPYLTDTFDDPQQAFEETKKALQMISKNFNKGRKQAQKVSTFNEAQEQVKENNL